MNDDILYTEKYFNLNTFEFRDLFNYNYPWETLTNIVPFIKQLFASRKLTSNFRDYDDVYIGEGTFVHPSVEIDGPAIIGRNCTIKHGAYMREGCLIGDNVNIGHAVEVKHSIFLNNSKAAHLNYIGDSIIGNDVNISGGVITANYRLDKKNIVIKVSDFITDTGINKLGAVVGDNSIIGVNSVLNPGSFLGKNSVVYPLKSVSGVHGEKSIIK